MADGLYRRRDDPAAGESHLDTIPNAKSALIFWIFLGWHEEHFSSEALRLRGKRKGLHHDSVPWRG